MLAVKITSDGSSGFISRGSQRHGQERTHSDDGNASLRRTQLRQKGKRLNTLLLTLEWLIACPIVSGESATSSDLLGGRRLNTTRNEHNGGTQYGC